MEARVIPIQPYAGFWRRLPAFLFDILIVGLIKGSLFPLILNTQQVHPIIDELLHLLIYHLYFVLMTKYNDGQTLGKMLLSIRVISEDHQALSWKQIFFREVIGRYINNHVLYLPYLATAFTPNKEQLGDYIADTRVIKDDYWSIEEATEEV